MQGTTSPVQKKQHALKQVGQKESHLVHRKKRKVVLLELVSTGGLKAVTILCWT